MSETAKKSIFKRWWFWAAVVVVILIIGTSGGDDQQNADSSDTNAKSTAAPATSAPAAEVKKEEPKKAEPPKNKPSMSKEEFDQIQTGMTLEQVANIVGGEGDVLSEAGEGEFKTVMRQFAGDGGLGANANVTFQNGKVMAKAQFGLK